MNPPTNIQLINGPDGHPAYVVIPYADYMRQFEQARTLIPHEVISATVDGATPARAWREYLKLTQLEVAMKLGISQPSYARQESSERLRPQTVVKRASALGNFLEQLDF